MAAKNVMIDIESLSLQTDALVLSVGAVEFELTKTGPIMGKEFISVPDMTDQIARGRHVDQATQRWWMDQPSAASMHWRAPAHMAMTPQVFCNQFTDWLGPKEILVVWANGIVFDIGVLQHFFTMYGAKVPWKYDAVRDARTVYKLQPETATLAPSPDRVAHHPLSDCRVQIERLWMHGLVLG